MIYNIIILVIITISLINNHLKNKHIKELIKEYQVLYNKKANHDLLCPLSSREAINQLRNRY